MADVIPIPAALLCEVRHGVLWAIGSAAESLGLTADRLCDRSEDLDVFDDFWGPGARVDRLLQLADAVKVFTGDRPANLDGRHRRTLVDVLSFQEESRRSELADAVENADTTEARTLLDTIDALSDLRRTTSSTPPWEDESCLAGEAVS